jgi:hypothetical protein
VQAEGGLVPAQQFVNALVVPARVAEFHSVEPPSGQCTKKTFETVEVDLEQPIRI